MKQCPQCNASCENNDAVCSNCGYIFAPQGFDPNAFSNQQNPQPNNNQNYNPNASFNQSPNMNWSNNQQPVQKNNGMSIASLVLGIIGTVFGCCYGIGLIPGIIAVITGFISNAKIKKSNGAEKGTGFAIAGIILGFVGILLAVYMIVSFIANRDKIVSLLQEILSESSQYSKYSN